NYFDNEWLRSNDTWYEGLQLYTPSTNDALEAINKTIKDDGTFRERLVLSRFLTIASNIVNNWSIERDTSSINVKLFATEPTISLQLWTSSYQWAKLIKDITTFNQFKKSFDIWCMEMENGSDWKTSKCNCPAFLKNYICKHAVGMAIRLKYCKSPAAAKTVPIGEKRKRGRPANAKPALLAQ
ncbi:unnamed protein product, partial [Rotaria sp. Silwood2]